MQKNLIISLLLTVLIVFGTNRTLFSQAPHIEWQNTIGGSEYDELRQVIPTSDGGYIIGGNSNSGISGDKSEMVIGGNDGDADFWIVKVDVSGNIEWENSIGGNEDDEILSICETSDDGYFLGGYSYSGVSGDKTDPALGSGDCWLMKLNSSGNILWQKTIGGSGIDIIRSVQSTTDGGYILGCTSTSPVSDDKSENGSGSYDFWVVKLNAAGEIEWDNTIGGSKIDYLNKVIQTSDGGFIAGGYSSSSISGDKTENNKGLSYTDDYWIVKLNTTGTIQWQNTIGANNQDQLFDLKQTADAGYILAGVSSSNINHDKTEAAMSYDYWIVKVNSLGVVEWENTIGGESWDYPFSIDNTDDGGFVVAGYSQSDISGDKTDNLNGGTDYWILKLDPSGSIEWQNSIGGEGSDYGYYIQQTEDYGFILGGYSDSYASGDKTEDPLGMFTTDYWIIKLAPDCIPAAELCNTLDDNCNGLIDDGVIETISISAGGATTFCQGGSVLLSATYSGASIQWKKNGSNIPGAIASTYSVNKSGNYSAVTTSPCGTATSSIINVTVNKNPNASISAGGATSFCAGGSVTLTEIPVAGSTYQWFKDASLIAGATSVNYIATTAGNFKCRVTKTATGCYKNSNAISVTVPCKEGEVSVVNGELGFKIFPNPNSGTFEISVQNLASATSPFEGGLRGMSIDFFNSIGQLIYSRQINSTDNNFSETISLDNISSGIYFVRIGDGNNYAEQKLIIL